MKSTHAAPGGAKSRSEETRRRVYDWLRGRGMTGASDEEIGISLGLSRQVAGKHRRALVAAGRVRKSLLRRDSPRTAGYDPVYVAVDARHWHSTAYPLTTANGR